MSEGLSAPPIQRDRRTRRERNDGPGRAPARPLAWRVIDDGPLDGALNMALDEALARESAEGCGVLRLYGWARPTISFGRNEPASQEYSPARIDEAGFDCVRRPTGGRAVLHAREVTYSVVMPLRAMGGFREVYHRINVALVGALSALGASVQMSEEDRVAPLAAGPCFGTPARGEVVSSGRKLVGSAQARVDDALLQHGSVLLAGDQSPLDGIRREDGPVNAGASATAAGTATSLSRLVGAVEDNEVRAEVARAMQREFGGDWDSGDYSMQERARAESLLSSRYTDAAWTWRR